MWELEDYIIVGNVGACLWHWRHRQATWRVKAHGFCSVSSGQGVGRKNVLGGG